MILHHWWASMVVAVRASAGSLPWWSWSLQLLGVAGSYTGAVLNARQDIRGFQAWIVSNLLLLVVHLTSGLWLLAVLDVLYFRINVKAIGIWRLKSREASH